jgi:FMN phosphatase YigB (HAD superfamily)
MNPTRAPFVFLDIGGTLLVPGTSLEELVETVLFARRLVRSGDAVRAAVATAVAAHAAAAPDLADREDRERPAAGRRELYTRVFRELALDESADALAAAVWEMSFELAPPVLAPGAHAALELLRGAGARLGVISNWDDSIDDVLTRTGVRPYLEVVVASYRVGWSKPNRRIFDAALAAAGVEAAQAWHVGDDVYADARGALDAGLRTVLVDARPGARDGLPAGALHASRVDEAAHLLLAAHGQAPLAGHAG